MNTLYNSPFWTDHGGERPCHHVDSKSHRCDGSGRSVRVSGCHCSCGQYRWSVLDGWEQGTMPPPATTSRTSLHRLPLSTYCSLIMQLVWAAAEETVSSRTQLIKQVFVGCWFRFLLSTTMWGVVYGYSCCGLQTISLICLPIIQGPR